MPVFGDGTTDGPGAHQRRGGREDVLTVLLQLLLRSRTGPLSGDRGDIGLNECGVMFCRDAELLINGYVVCLY